MKLKKIVHICVIMLFSWIMLTGCEKKEINLNDYVTVEFSGYDGYGEAAIVFNKEAFAKDCEKIKISNANIAAMYGNASEYYNDFCILYDVSERKNLSNGDVINLTWNCEDALASNNTSGILNHSDISFEVAGLKTAPTFDVFEGVTLEVSGISPYATATISGGFEDFAYSAEENATFAKTTVEGVKNGDIITVYANQYMTHSMTMDEIVEIYGGIPESMTKEFVVEELDEYVTKLSDIPAEDIAAMDAEARSIIESYQSQIYGSQKCEVALTGKAVGTPEFWIDYKLCLIYTLSYPGENGFDYYWNAAFPNVIKKPDGTLSYNLGEQKYPQGSQIFGMISGDGFIRDDIFHVGYETLEELKDAAGLNSGTWDTDME